MTRKNALSNNNRAPFGRFPRRGAPRAPAALAAVVLALTIVGSAAPAAAQCDVTAEVVAMDQVITYNRMGAFNPAGMIFALERDVFPRGHAGSFDLASSCYQAGAGVNPACSAGMVQLRPDKRPRPLTLRVNEGETICVNFTNLLSAGPITDAQNEAAGIQVLQDPVLGRLQSEQPVTRNAGFHVNGLNWAGGPADDGSNVGVNASSLVAPNFSASYAWTGIKEGAYVISSGPDQGGEGGSGAIANGLFGVLNVEPAGSEWYRSQLTRAEMDLATPPEAFTDWNGNDAWDQNIPEPLADWNGNGVQDSGIAEPLTDWNGNGVQDSGIAEPFTDSNGNGVYDLGEPLTDWNANGVWDASVNEPFTDWNANGVWDASVNEPFTDWNGSGSWDASITEPLVDTNGDGIWQAHRVTPGGQPILDYNALYPATSDYAGLPILNIVQGGEIVHNELNAIITGYLRSGFSENPSPIYPNRGQPFREFTIAFHDEFKVVQAFPEWYKQLKFTLGVVKDGFGVNYGSGGIGSEIIGNRLGVGPMKDCVECKYEEFFLTAWAVGDPAMIVDVPASAGLEACDPALNNCLVVGGKATKAFYPDDPANVWHGYLNDRTKVRNIHVGTEHHIFHLHAHQWGFAALDEGSNYLDAQAIGPGSSFTYEIAFGGGGNRAKSPGDAIFHCHFYPHFAQGMWGLWRIHDVFERGTPLAADGITPAAGSRALPDGEIAAGTPIPGVVPIPGRPMAPMPEVDVEIVGGQPVIAGTTTPISEATGNPGFPFFIPGVAGHRPPTPPMDLVADGGLPRHVIAGGAKDPLKTFQTATNFDAVLGVATGFELPEGGTPAEIAAMDFHGPQTGATHVAFHDTYDTDGLTATGTDGFQVNGLPPQMSAPYADPCRADIWSNDVSIPWSSTSIGNPRQYKASVIELDVDLNKVGWHFGQQRIIVLDEDIQDTLDGLRAPEPFVMRANTMDCVNFDHTNRVPNVYQLDDFQVKTPTDVIGQHIHLVKFDIMTADGAANGWNYEDGTLSADEITERLHALKAIGGSWAGLNGETAADLPPDATGFRTTRQRWFIDPGWMGNVFTHDHYGPSTHQQAGLYATLLVEPRGSVWTDPVSGVELGTRVADGGPTSWKADIDCTGCSDARWEGDAWREFYLEFADFQVAYRGQNDGGALNGAGTPVNPSYRNQPGLPFILQPNAAPLANPTASTVPGCGNGQGVNNPASPWWTGCAPEAISGADPGTFVVNYRNEPVALRVRDPLTNAQADPLLFGPQAGDLSYAFSSNILRADTRLNTAPEAWPYNAPGAIQTPNQGALTGDPFTPLLQVYEGDKVMLRVQVGAHEEGHNFSINGIRWLQQWNSGYSGFRNSQMAGISEYFLYEVPSMGASKNPLGFEDYMYQTGSSVDARWNGTWGIMRAYDGDFGTDHLQPLPTNLDGKVPPVGGQGGPPPFKGPCPRDAAERKFDIVAARAVDVLPSGTLEYNPELDDPTALLYLKKSDLTNQGKLRADRRVEPLILRAAAGECVFVTLTNMLPATLHGPDPAFPATTNDLAGFNLLPMIVNDFNANQLAPSSDVGLHAQLVEYDMFDSDGMNVGFNPVQTAPPGGTTTYKWYAGKIDIDAETGDRTAVPIEYGAINLSASDPIKGSNKGLIGALVIEPPGSTWPDGSGRGNNRTQDGEFGPDGLLSRAAVTVCKDGNVPCTPGTPNSFRDFVLIYQDDVNMRFTNPATFTPPCADPAGPLCPSITVAAGDPVPTVSEEEEPEDSGQKGLNYRTDPLWLRLGIGPTAVAGVTRQIDFTNAFSGTPVTPIYTAAPGDEVRFRVLKPGGHNRNQVFALHGHVWARHPFDMVDTNGDFIPDPSSIIDASNPYTFWHGEQMGHGPSNHFNAVPLNGAGGLNLATGDYLYRDIVPVHVYNGEWGIFRVE